MRILKIILIIVMLCSPLQSALDFTGSNQDYCLIGDVLNQHPITAFTISCWFNWSIDSDGGLFGFDNGDMYAYNVGSQLLIAFYSETVIRYYTFPQNADSLFTTSFTPGHFKFYMNGTLISDNNFTDSFDSRSFAWGSYEYHYAGTSFGGKIWHAKIWSRQLSDAEVLAEYNAKGSIINSSGMLSWLLMSDKPAGTPSDDSAGEVKDVMNLSPGTCYNSPVFVNPIVTAPVPPPNKFMPRIMRRR